MGNSGENSSRTPANVALTACAHKLVYVLPQLNKANCYGNSILYIVLVICFLLPLLIPVLSVKNRVSCDIGFGVVLCETQGINNIVFVPLFLL